MRLKNALETLHQEHASDELYPLYTPWGEKLDPEHVWEEYPRPQMHRENFCMLNGFWDYVFISPQAQQPQPGKPFIPDGKISVPFSPESLLSGVNRQLQPQETLWYQRTISFTTTEMAQKEVLQRRCLLHFGAVDQQAAVYINGKEMCSHRGGYLPFCVDITDEVKEEGNLIQVCVRDESDTSWYARGKQTLKRGGMFYTAQSGIWQSVWLEWVPQNPVLSMKITPDYDHGRVMVELASQKPFEQVRAEVFPPVLLTDGRTEIWDAAKGKPLPIKLQCSTTPSKFSGSKINDTETTSSDSKSNDSETTASNSKSNDTNPTASGCNSNDLNLSASGCKATDSVSPCFLTRLTFTLPSGEGGPFSWSPDTPYLYPFTVTADEDRLDSYFAMRRFTIEPGETKDPCFCLNHKPLFLHGILDQGYWPDGLMTAPCDEAFLYDIRLAKQYGFNMLRKHIKIEPLRWYYHCDRLGMLVWQDMVSGGATYHMPLVCYLPTLFPFLGLHLKDDHYRLFSRSSREGRLQWEQECLETIEHLYSVPSLSVWVPFNEGWGQFDAKRIAEMVKKEDPTRPVDHASGWFDQKGGDFKSVHNYFRPLKVLSDHTRAFVISEYGGLACHVDGHSCVDRVYGYQKYDNCEELSQAFRRLMEQKLNPLRTQGLSGAVYTQLSDVEEEVNGLVTYDRRIVKLSPPEK